MRKADVRPVSSRDGKKADSRKVADTDVTATMDGVKLLLPVRHIVCLKPIFHLCNKY